MIQLYTNNNNNNNNNILLYRRSLLDRCYFALLAHCNHCTAVPWPWTRARAHSQMAQHTAAWSIDSIMTSKLRVLSFNQSSNDAWRIFGKQKMHFWISSLPFQVQYLQSCRYHIQIKEQLWSDIFLATKTTTRQRERGLLCESSPAH